MESQASLHGAITRRLSRTISFDDAFLALLQDDLERETDPLDEEWNLLPGALPEFENAMHQECIY